MDPITITVAEARRFLGIGNTKLYELIQAQDVESVKIGRRRLIVLGSLKRLIAKHAQGTAEIDGTAQ